MNKSRLLFIPATLFLLSACENPYKPTMRPDYTIHVVSTAKGDVAIPPKCPSWSSEATNPFDEQPLPQFGCATARNLAMSVERPSDLVRGRDLGPARGAEIVGGIRRYDNSQPRGLIDPSTNADSAVAASTSSAPASSLSGDVTGGASAASSSSSSSTSAGP